MGFDSASKHERGNTGLFPRPLYIVLKDIKADGVEGGGRLYSGGLAYPRPQYDRV